MDLLAATQGLNQKNLLQMYHESGTLYNYNLLGVEEMYLSRNMPSVFCIWL